jgi:hypothetical protein
LSYKPTRHGKAGVGATKGSAHTSLKWFVDIPYIFHPFLSFCRESHFPSVCMRNV